MTASPPITPPTMAPVLDLLPLDAGVGLAVDVDTPDEEPVEPADDIAVMSWLPVDDPEPVDVGV